MSLITKNEDKIFAKGVIGNVRKAQEDCHGYKLDTPNGDLFVVCDGMGGHVGGATASKIAVESIINYINQEQYATPVDALNGALQFANMQILGYADSHPEFKGMGTTACIVLIKQDEVWIAHVGDSRIYLYLGKEGRLHRITKDHSFVQTLVDAGEITDDEAEHHPNKNRILKALGIKSDLQPSFNYENMPIHPKNGDVFLICSDGLSGMITDSTIEKVLNEEVALSNKGEMLIALAMQGETVIPGGQDNCTVELIEIDNSQWKKSEFKSFNPYRPSSPKDKTPKTDASGVEKTDASGKRNGRALKIAIVVTAVLLAALVSAIAYSSIHENKIQKARLEFRHAQKELLDAKVDRTVKERAFNDRTKKLKEVELNKPKSKEERIAYSKIIKTAQDAQVKAKEAKDDAEKRLRNKRTSFFAAKEKMEKMGIPVK